MMLLSMMEQSSSIAPTEWMEQAGTFLAVNTKSGPYNLAATLRVLEIILDVVFLHLHICIMMRARGEGGGASFACM